MPEPLHHAADRILDALHRAWNDGLEQVARDLADVPDVHMVRRQGDPWRVEFRRCPPGAQHVDEMGPPLAVVVLEWEGTTASVVRYGP